MISYPWKNKFRIFPKETKIELFNGNSLTFCAIWMLSIRIPCVGGMFLTESLDLCSVAEAGKLWPGPPLCNKAC